jgi:hypothetical protein
LTRPVAYYGVTVRLAILDAPPNVAVTGTTVFVPTAVVVIVKAADVAPALTVTVVGGMATEGSSLVSMTAAPPAGAGPLRVTVLCVVERPPFTLAGDSINDATCGESTVIWFQAAG